MGISVSDTKVAMLGSVSKLVSLLSTLGVGGVSRAGSWVRPMSISGSLGGDVLCSLSAGGGVTLTAGGVGLSESG